MPSRRPLPLFSRGAGEREELTGRTLLEAETAEDNLRNSLNDTGKRRRPAGPRQGSGRLGRFGF